MTGRHIRRFDKAQRATHLAMMVSFLGLAFTGSPLLFHDAPWAARLARLLGGLPVAGRLHRFFAVVLILVFAVHVGRIVRRLFIDRDLGVLWGPSSMVPQPRDLRELSQHVRWFVGRGPRPRFDHFTYWEKFDYWAVFWGMFIIGGSGLLLWFPAFFAHVLPGWVYNVALLIHGEEALLAVAFIFTIHFFNGHLRPDKFPMDTVIFTGTVDEDEFRKERPDEYERLVREGGLDALTVPPPKARVVRRGRIVGTIAVLFGLMLFCLIIHAVVHHP
ncbi:MAG TPA: cytochrome b/b6 domain-containing protein [Candidatus Polarisedimenticolaceae bacterium]|nr:cytochrome b/b6 domain-containing protein [Candidatus Polarisedimenticolaceae bacterium]